jgi:hypothetical protein
VTFAAHFLPEPLLEFSSGQRLEHPQDGLFLYGPVMVPGSPELIQVGAIGTPDGIDLVRQWLHALVGRIAVEDATQLHTVPWPSGFSNSAFCRKNLITSRTTKNRFRVSSPSPSPRNPSG